jgi:hypothetical protein
MAYYTALQTAWNGATQPPNGVTGTAITGAMTTAQKLAAINTWTVPNPQKAILSPSAVLNAIVAADLAALTATQVSFLTLVLQGSSIDASVGTTVRAAIQTIFTGKTTTLSQLGSLVAPYDNVTQPWWQANGYPRAFDLGDVSAGGLS